MSTRGKKPNSAIPNVPGLLLTANYDRIQFTAQYDCPWCGKEHIADLNQFPPVTFTPPCDRGLVNLHRIDERCVLPSDLEDGKEEDG